LAALEVVEREERVRVLLAVESGSRAWGFASPDSDWDVRFVYVRSLTEYLSIKRRRDVIERDLPGDIDLVGWDLPKALSLFSKSNPALMEWLRSPIVYVESRPFVEAMRELELSFGSPLAGMYHYRSMAVTNHRVNFDCDQVKLKKYLYVVRPILACLWLEHRGTWPPVPFAELVEAETDPGELREIIAGLVAEKSARGELGVGPRIPTLDRFIESELARLQGLSLPNAGRVELGPLDDLFRRCVLEAN
jgi:hypothetical protein